MNIAALLPGLFDLVGKLFPDPAQKAEAQRKLLELQQNGEFRELEAAVQTQLAQVGLNKEEAQSLSRFNSGWRPFIGWVCGSALVYQYILRPLLTWGAALLGHPEIIAPELDMGDIITIMLGMLGLGTLRTVEKINREKK